MKIINNLTLETRDGYKEFLLIVGDIFEVNADLLLFSSHTFKGNVHGSISKEVSTLYGNRYWNQMTSIFVQNNKSFIKPPLGQRQTDQVDPPSILFMSAPKADLSDLLLARIPSPQLFSSESECLNAYELSLQAAFSSLSVLEYNGHNYKSIKLPILGGARAFDKTFTIAKIIEHSIKWLSYSKYTFQIKFVVQMDSEAQMWNDAMNQYLGREYEDLDHSRLLKELQMQLKALIQQCLTYQNNTDFKDLLSDIDKDLQTKQIFIHQFGTHARRLVELVSKDICKDIGEPTSDNAFSNIEKIEKSQKVAKWINSYLHNLRILGNESVHAMDRSIRIPDKLTQSDLFVLITNMIRVIEFYYAWKKTHPNT